LLIEYRELEMARSSILRSTGPRGALCILVALFCMSCSDEGVRPANGDTPVCAIDPFAIDFGTVETGEFVDTTVTITNAGEIPFTCCISTDSRHYEILCVTGPDTLGQGECLVLAVRFQPDTVGAIPGTIETGCGACGAISCTGFGVELSVCDIEPRELDFGARCIGEYLDGSFILRNAGYGIIRGEIGEASEHYTIMAGGGPYAIGAGESVSVTVRYEPAATGLHTCVIETGTSACPEVICTGTGLYAWRKIASGTSADLYGVWGSSSSDVIAVGTGGTIVRYNGSSWSEIHGIASFPLYDVWGTASYDIFVVGAARTLFHYNGYSWGFMNSPAAGDLRCIDGTAWNDVFAAGKGAMRFDGSVWSVILGVDRSLTDMWAYSASEIFMVDTIGTILHYDGTEWSELDSAINTRLNAIWGSAPDDIFVVDAEGNIFHYDGARWRRVYSIFYSDLRAIWGSAPDDVYVAGQYFTVLHYDGEDWEMILRDGTWEDTFYGIWGSSAGDVFFVGTGGAMHHYGRLVD